MGKPALFNLLTHQSFQFPADGSANEVVTLKKWYIFTVIVYTMLRNITFSAEEEWIARARAKASAEKSTLNELFRRWLRQYVERGKTGNEIDMVMDSMDYVYSEDFQNRQKIRDLVVINPFL